MRRLILIAGGTELALFIASRMILAHWHWSGWEWQSDLLRSLSRAGAAFVLWYFFRSIIFSGVTNREEIRHPLFVAAVSALLAVPLLIGNWYFMGPFTRFIFVLTSVVVGIHEEFLFRGIMQNVIARRFGVLSSVAITSAVMTAWHVGALPLNAFNFAQVFIVSCVLGLIYAKTRSIFVVVFLHSFYDALWPLTPVLVKPLSWHWGVVLLGVSFIFTWMWARREA